MVVGLILAANALAYAGLLCPGRLGPGLLVAASALLAGTAVGAVFVALAAEHSGVLGASFGVLVIIYALIPTAAGLSPHPADPTAAVSLEVVLIGLVSVVAGACFWLLGVLRLADIGRFLPYPVVAGFMGGIGVLFVTSGTTFRIATAAGAVAGGAAAGGAAAGGATAWAALVQALACLGYGTVLFAITRTLRSPLVMPLLLVLTAPAFNLGRALAGIAPDAAMRAGWMLGPFAAGHLGRLPDLQALARVHAGMLAGLPSIVFSVVLVGAINVMIATAALDQYFDRPFDAGRAMRTAGTATMLAGLFGGIVTAQHFGRTVLAEQLGGRSRLAGVVSALVCVAALFVSARLLDYVPRFLIGGLLVFNGLVMVFDRIWLSRRTLPPAEWGVVLLVAASVAGLGFLRGLLVGLGLALVLFAWSYRRLPLFRLVATGAEHRSHVLRPEAEAALLRREGGAIRLLRLQGYMFFLNATALQAAAPPAGTRFLILDFRDVPGVDSSAIQVLRRLQRSAEERGCMTLCSGLSGRLRDALMRQGVAPGPPGLAAGFAEPEALEYAEAALIATAGLQAPESASFASLLDDGQATDVARRLDRYLERHAVEAGAVLTRQGESAETVFLVVRGGVSVWFETEGGAAVVVATAGPGVVIGEIAFYAGGRRTATVRADSRADVESVSRAAIERMQLEDPDLASRFHRAMVRMLADKLASSTRQLGQSRA